MLYGKDALSSDPERQNSDLLSLSLSLSAVSSDREVRDLTVLYEKDALS